MEARLGTVVAEALSLAPATSEKRVGSPEANEAVAPQSEPATEEGAPAVFNESAAEADFLAGARDRGEVVAPPKIVAEPVEDSGKQNLPSLGELVQRIPPDVRETLEELFRAKFVKVRRVPAGVLKS